MLGVCRSSADGTRGRGKLFLVRGECLLLSVSLHTECVDTVTEGERNLVGN